jgi:Domain of unknown function (DUF4406)
MNKGTAYISGKITGMPNLNKYKFVAAETLLNNNGFATINPHKLPEEHDKSWESYMKTCIGALTFCDCVFVLDDWKYSRGAVCEVYIAIKLGLPIYSIETHEPVKMPLYLKIKMILNLI